MGVTVEQLIERVTAAHPEAQGCGLCRRGLLAWPDPSQLSVPLLYQRALALRLGRLTLCDCPTGQAQRKGLERVLARLYAVPVVECDRGLIWNGHPPPDYAPGSWWAAVRAAEMVEFKADVPTFHGSFQE